MTKKLIALVVLPGLAAALLLIFFQNKKPDVAENLPFERSTYWLSWAQNNKAYTYSKLYQIPDGIDYVIVAFALEKKDNTGLLLQLNKDKQFLQDMQYLKKRKIKILVSTGGANGQYPWHVQALSDKAISDQYIDLLKKYDFDGIDFDVEKGDARRVPPIIRLIKQWKPSVEIRLTVPVGLKGLAVEYRQLAQQIYQDHNLDKLVLMNYDHFSSGPQACWYHFDLAHPGNSCYISSLLIAVQQISDWLPNEKQAKQMMINGLMLGCADDGYCLSPEESLALSRWLKKAGFGGLMTWAINRDQPAPEHLKDLDTSTGLTGLPVSAFTNLLLPRRGMLSKG